jgi:hypothetical protein
MVIYPFGHWFMSDWDNQTTMANKNWHFSLNSRADQLLFYAHVPKFFQAFLDAKPEKSQILRSSRHVHPQI